MPRPTMRRLAATVVASAVLAGGLAAGSGAASAAPAGSVAAMPTGSTGGVENISPIEFLGGVFFISAIFLASGSAPAPCPTYGGCNM
ncbi:hypothetical protein O4215_17070 [Rhodococcus maanshanensis]|uniref:hypothetical protein n=1 Tax=Rhodococcus maanshanensis TaxID=183556 RepID=UPI0022B5B5FF|nr:hypothetical protein [Rhodococcus maanshanensis]MCZ4557282.1 hypothetical protein [Rhodococcus maanshanensis]